jgi:hypothetical protein
MQGEQFTTHSDGSRRRDLIELRLSHVPLRIRQTAAGMSFRRENLNGKTIHTTTIEFGNVRVKQRKRIEAIAQDLA